MEIRTLADVASEVLHLTLNPAVLARFRNQIAEFQRDAGRYIHEARVWEDWPSKLVRATKRGSRLRNYKAGAPTPHHTWWVAAVGGHGKPIVQFGAWIDLRERGPKPIDPRVPGWLPMDYGLCAAAHDHVYEGKGKRPELRLGHIVPDQYPAKSDAKLGVALASAQRVAWGALKYWSVAGEDDREPTEQERVGRLIVALNHVRADLEAHGLGAAPTAKTDAGGFDAIPSAFDRFYRTLDATTVPAAGGGRTVGGIAHAVALSEATSALYGELGATYQRLIQQHGQTVAEFPPGVALMESDSPDGPWTPIPAGEIRMATMGIGGNGADAMLLAALESATKVAAFPLDKWNAMQAARPGASHQRFHAGDVVSAADLEVLESAAKLLRMKALPAPPTVSVSPELLQRLEAGIAAVHSIGSNFDADMARVGRVIESLGAREDGPKSAKKPKPTRRERWAKWLAEAMLTVRDHPEWSDATIAERAGIDKSRLSRSPEYQTAARMARTPKTSDGSVTIADGGRSVEAVDDSFDPNRPASRQWQVEEDTDNRIDREMKERNAKRNGRR